MKFIEVTVALTDHKIYVNPYQIVRIEKNNYGYTLLCLATERFGAREVAVNESLENVLSMCGGCETIERVYRKKELSDFLNEHRKGEDL